MRYQQAVVKSGVLIPKGFDANDIAVYHVTIPFAPSQLTISQRGIKRAAEEPNLVSAMVLILDGNAASDLGYFDLFKAFFLNREQSRI